MLTRLDPFAEMLRLQSMFAEPAKQPVAPAVDIIEDDQALVVRAELPGVKAEDLAIEVENNVLTLSGERKAEARYEKAGVHRVERWTGRFARSFTLPRSVDAEHIDAKLKDGVLELTLPKRAEAKQRKISVKTD